MASFWLEEPPEPLPQRTLPGDPDVEIVGGGVTGCSCALALAAAGFGSDFTRHVRSRAVPADATEALPFAAGQ